jgi:hypothetical protein
LAEAMLEPDHCDGDRAGVFNKHYSGEAWGMPRQIEDQIHGFGT